MVALLFGEKECKCTLAVLANIKKTKTKNIFAN